MVIILIKEGFHAIFIQQNVRFLDRTASSERSFMWQRRLAGKFLRVSLRTQDKNVTQYRAVKLTEAFIRLSQLMRDTNPLLIRETLLKARDKQIEDEFLSAVTARYVSPSFSMSIVPILLRINHLLH